MQSEQCVIDGQQLLVGRISSQLIFANYGSDGASFECLLYEVVAIQSLAFHRKEKLAWGNGSRIDGIARGNLAGKGHEKSQITREGPVPFDDAEVAREALRAAGFECEPARVGAKA